MARRTQGSAAPARARGVFLVRESDEYDTQLFQAMVVQTYERHSDIIDMNLITAVGLRPLTEDNFTVVFNKDGEARTVRVEVHTRGHGAVRVRVFYLAGFWHLWSQTSAARESSGINAFTSLVIAELERLRPEVLYAANFSRLIRSQRQGALLQATIDGNVKVVCAGGQRFVFEGDSDEVRMGKLAFSLLTQIAAWERDWIVQRLLAGAIAKWRRDEWVFGERAVPHGYRLDKHSGRLTPDPAQRRMVREMLKILSSDLPAREAVAALDAAGVRSHLRDEQTGERVPYGALTAPSQVVNSLYSWAGLWCHGEFLLRRRNVFRGISQLSGLTVMRHESDPEHEDTDDGEFQMLYRPGVPDGAWAEPELLHLFAATAVAHFQTRVSNGAPGPRPLDPAVAAASSNPELHALLLTSAQATGGYSRRYTGDPARAKERVSLFAGRSWDDGPASYELMVTKRAKYDLVMSTPVSQSNAPEEDPDEPDDSETASGRTRRTVGTFDGKRLAKGFVTALVEAMRDNVPVTRLAGEEAFIGRYRATRETQESRIHYLELQLAGARGDITRATALELKADEGSADERRYRDFARAATQRTAELMADLEVARAVLNDERQPTGPFDVFGSVLLPAMKRIATCDGQVPQSEYRAFKTLVPNFRLDRGEHGQWWASAWVRLPSAEGVAELGPIRWRVGRGGFGTQTATARVLNSNCRTPARTPAETADLRARLRRAGLVETAVNTLLASPFVEQPHVVLHESVGEKYPEWVSTEWRRAPYARWLTAVYSDQAFVWRGAGRFTRVSSTRQLLAYYATDHDEFTAHDAWAELPVVNPHAVYVMSQQTPHTGHVRPVEPTVQVMGERRPGHVPLLRGVRCECGAVANVVTRLPEVPRDLLCECGRMPDADAHGMECEVRFPRAYLTLRLSREQALLDARDELARRRQALSRGRARSVLMQLLATPQGLTDPELAAACGRAGSMTHTLSRLMSYGLLRRQGPKPMRYLLSEEGLRLARDLSS